MRPRSIAVLAFLLVLCAASSRAQPAVLDFTRISTEDGLSQDIVTCLLRDRSGFLWIGTEDGLNRYDGYTIRTFKHIPGDTTTVGDDWIIGLCQGAGGEILVATMRGLSIYDDRTDSFRPVGGAFVPFTDLSVRSPRYDAQGNLWLIAGRTSVLRYAPGFSSVRRFDVFSEGQSLGLHNLLVDRRGRVVVGADSGLVIIDSTDRPRWLPCTEATTSGPRRVDVTAILEDGPGAFWIGSRTGLYHYDEATATLTFTRVDRGEEQASAERDYLFDLAYDLRGRVWSAGFGGLYCYDPATGRSSSYQNLRTPGIDPSPPRLYTIAVDPSGMLWVGSWRGGLWSADLHNEQFGLLRHSFRTPFAGGSSGVAAIYEDPSGRMWFGNPSRGVTILEPRSGLYRHLLPGSGPGPRLSGGSITAITGDASGNVWIASSSATIDRYDAMKGTVRPLRLPAAAHGQVSILALYRDREGTLWIGTEAAGIYRYDVGREAFTDRHVPAVPSAWSFLEDRRGDLWIGGWTSDSRLRRVNGRTGETVTYEDPALRSVRSMVEDPDGTLWLGSWGGGLSHLDPATGTVRNYRDTDGLPSNYVKGVLQDARGEVWMGTERGLCVLTPVTGAIRRYDVSDGLQGNFFYSGSCLRARDGRLFFGGTEGVNGFSPDSIHASVYTAPVLVTGVRVSGERERFLRGDGGADGIKVSYRENVLGFEFVALDYRSPARNRYAFMMEGFDAGWIDAGTRRYAMYTHLDPGTYVFKVRGSNSDGVWNPAPAALRLTVLPVYWQTWWFRGALVACAVGLLVGFYRYRVGRLLELERTRTAIATDLHDDIGTSLTTIALFSDLAKNDIALGTGDAVRRLEKIAQTSRSLLDSMNDIVWSIKPENDGLERTILRMEDYAVSLLEENGVDLHVQVPEQLRGLTLPMAVRRNLFLIFKEALGNILKHAGASAVEVRIATIELPQGGRGIRLSIRDNGKGFSQREGGQGNGLRNMNARARALGGGVDIESTPGAGTCVEVRVPLKSPV